MIIIILRREWRKFKRRSAKKNQPHVVVCREKSSYAQKRANPIKSSGVSDRGEESNKIVEIKAGVVVVPCEQQRRRHDEELSVATDQRGNRMTFGVFPARTVGGERGGLNIPLSPPSLYPISYTILDPITPTTTRLQSGVPKKAESPDSNSFLSPSFLPLFTLRVDRSLCCPQRAPLRVTHT